MMKSFLKKSIVVLVLVILLSAIVITIANVGNWKNNNKTETLSTTETVEYLDEDLPYKNYISNPEFNEYLKYNHFNDIEELGELRIIEEQEYFKIVRGQNNLKNYYFIFDKERNVVTEGGLNRMPHIEMLDDRTVSFWYQAGTGSATRWGYFYDVEADLLSPVFKCIYDAYGSLVLLGKSDKIIVRDIFDGLKYYREFEFAMLEKEFLDGSASLVASFIDDGRAIKITYDSIDREEITEIIELEY